MLRTIVSCTLMYRTILSCTVNVQNHPVMYCNVQNHPVMYCNVQNHPVMYSNVQLILFFNSSLFLAANRTLVSSGYTTGLAPWCNPYGKTFKYIIKSRGPRIDPWGTPLITVSQLEDFSCSRMCGDVQTLCFLFSR